MTDTNNPRPAFVLSLLLLFVLCALAPVWAQGDPSATEEASGTTMGTGKKDTDPYLWLENIDGAKAMAWVHQQDDRTLERLKSKPEYAGLYKDALAVLDSKSRVPEVDQHGTFLYSLLQNEEHPRGLYRRTPIQAFLQGTPEWQSVLDVDALSQKEGKAWALRAVRLGNELPDALTCLPPAQTDCLLQLHPGGEDAAAVREFNVETLKFVDGGFFLPAAKSSVAWIDADTLFVGTDFGDGSLTTSGYPRIVKIWKRGTPLSAARTVYEANPDSVSASGTRIRTSAGDIDLVIDSVTFWKSHFFQLVDSKLKRLDLPETADIEGGYKGQLVISLKSEWKRGEITYPNGSVLLADPAALRGGEGSVRLLVKPTSSEVVKDVDPMPQGILITMLDNVRGRLYRYQTDGSMIERQAISFPDNGALSVISTSDETGDAFLKYESFLTPPTLYYVAAEAAQPQEIAAQAPTFDSSGFQVQQLWATSADGTRVPYFVVGPRTMELNGKNPVWMFSYGGFEVSLTPSYSGSYEALHGAYGKLWLERGGVFVLANIRGGGEFGPAWHTQALEANHVKAFEDFEAVARDLVARKITSPQHLGIEGRSNGGLLVSSTMIRHPELYGAVVCGNPLIDMKRYNKLLAGASWMAEYGNPDIPEDWAYIKTYSPYQNVKLGQDYPPIFFYSTTRDDRVHPGHARKMVAKMEAMGYDVDYFENTEGGHHGSVTNEQLATRLALSYTFLWEHLK